MSKTKQAKAHLVFEWLKREFPTRRAAKLTFMRIPNEGKDGLEGYVVEDKDGIEVVVDERLRGYTMISTLLHEYAHIKSRRGDRHGQVFREWNQRIDDRYWTWQKAKQSG